jgi:aryl-alcohol dehydrogenase-like predicted oxidoreductase
MLVGAQYQEVARMREAIYGGTSLETRRFGKTDMDITRLGVGTYAIGGTGWEWSWGPQDDDQSVAAIRRALDMGINWIDTAAVYGFGHAEEIVAKALEGRSTRPYVFTKCSMLWDDNGQILRSMKADSVRLELEDSLRRLKVDVIDLYQIHWPVPEEEIEEGWATLARLKEEGKVRFIGVSNFNVEQMERCRRIAPIDTLQPPYSLVDRTVDADVLPYALAHDMGVIVYAPMMSGLLTGAMTRERAAGLPLEDWRSRNDEFMEPRLSRNLDLVEVLRSIGQRHGRSPGEVAIAWTLLNPAVTAAIVGVRNPDQLDGVLGAASLRLADEDRAEIEAFLRARP